MNNQSHILTRTTSRVGVRERAFCLSRGVIGDVNVVVVSVPERTCPRTRLHLLLSVCSSSQRRVFEGWALSHHNVTGVEPSELACQHDNTNYSTFPRETSAYTHDNDPTETVIVPLLLGRRYGPAGLPSLADVEWVTDDGCALMAKQRPCCDHDYQSLLHEPPGVCLCPGDQVDGWLTQCERERAKRPPAKRKTGGSSLATTENG